MHIQQFLNAGNVRYQPCAQRDHFQADLWTAQGNQALGARILNHWTQNGLRARLSLISVEDNDDENEEEDFK